MLQRFEIDLVGFRFCSFFLVVAMVVILILLLTSVINGRILIIEGFLGDLLLNDVLLLPSNGP